MTMFPFTGNLALPFARTQRRFEMMSPNLDPFIDLLCDPGGLSGLQCSGMMAFSVATSAITAALGVGGGVLLLAMLAMVLPISAVVPVHGTIQLGSNATRTFLYRRDINRRWLLVFVLGSIPGVAVGALLAAPLSENVLQAALGACLVVSLWRPYSTSTPPSKRLLFAVGSGTSFLSMLVGGTGPLVATTLMGRAQREVVIGTHAAFMSAQHSFKVSAFLLLGFHFRDWLPFIAAMIACGFLGALLGRMITLRLSERLFSYVFRGVISVLALRLFWGAVSAG